MLTSCCRAVIQAADEAELFSETCGIITSTGLYAMAWIGIAEDYAPKSVRAAAWSGGGAA